MNKKAVNTVIFIYLACSLSAAGSGDALERADKLVNEKKYNSAFNILVKADPGNDNPDILVRKTEILLNFFADSMMHKTFALRDLKPGESIEDIRGRPGDYELHIFPAGEILSVANRKNPGHGGLHRVLGNYYFQVYHVYGDRWHIDPLEVMNRALKYYGRATELSAMNKGSLYNYGILLLVKKDYLHAEKIFRELLDRDERSAPAWYHLAYIDYERNNLNRAMDMAKKALSYYNESSDRGSVWYLMGLINEKKESCEDAHESYVQALNYDNENYSYLKSLVISSLRTGRENDGMRYAEKMISREPENIGIFKDLIYVFGTLQFSKQLITVFDKTEKKYGKNFLILGNVYYSRALIFSRFSKNRKAAKKNFLKAADYYKQVYPGDHEVFEIINNELRK